MDLGIVIGLSGIFIAIFVATIVFVWQAISVSNRFDAGLQAQGERLGAEIRAQGQRVSDLELEQARLNGVNSVVISQAHTHETLAD